ncbi:Ubiquitin recognition factor in ER-associated degradation protein 1 [Paragonimus heterotremus]|uniref:Ubiquitin recognition factor in ER-associated degradation protein 1 n=1 Tax=Paragonimus heterotremus TaxID=100268 RepID=A0A8J4WGR9_9TREM|nr:Ubiquitin recognition factor in ER-associated degradation protein 1 [Paragonimus heterotremus]
MHFLFSQRNQNLSSSFSTSYKCFPVSFFPGNLRNSVENGGKVIMPPSVLEVLSRLNVQYPMLFKLTNAQANRTTHCGVLEFVADEGNIYVPYWMLRNLLLEEGGLVWVTNAALPVASFAKFQPQSTDFLDISNPKAVLENLLRDFACLTVGDIIAINYNERVYELKVLETQPEDAVSIIECDMRVDFAPPVGYEEQDNRSTAAKDKQPKQHGEDEEIFIPNISRGFQAFSGTGHRLDGKNQMTTDATPSSHTGTAVRERGIPNYDYKPGSLTFFRNARSCTAQVEDPVPFKPFEGVGHQLKPKAGAKP